MKLTTSLKNIPHFLMMMCLIFCVACKPEGTVIFDERGFTFQYEEAIDYLGKEEEDYHFFYEKDGLHVFFTMVEANSKDQAMANGLNRLGYSLNEFSYAGTGSFKQWMLSSLVHGTSKEEIATAYQYSDGKLFLVVVHSNDQRKKIGMPASPIMRLFTSITFTGESFKKWQPNDMVEVEQRVKQHTNSLGGSISIAVIKKGKVIYQHAHGESQLNQSANKETLYRWGSISKLLISTSIMQLIETKQLALDDEVNAFMPNMPKGITIRHLLTHSSDLPSLEVQHLISTDNKQVAPLTHILNDYLNQLDQPNNSSNYSPNYQPGLTASYNNWNFLILSVLIEQITKQPLVDYITQHILNPAKLNNTQYHLDHAQKNQAYSMITANAKKGLSEILSDHAIDLDDFFAQQKNETIQLGYFDILPAWGGVKSSALETAIFGSIFLQKGKLNNQQILKKSSVKTMLKMQKNNDKKALGTGLGWFIGSDKLGEFKQHSGGGPGIESLLRIYPKQELSIAVLGNINGYNPEQLTQAIARLLK